MSVVFTIGYEGSDIEKFLLTLKTVGIERLADVRAVTVSRKKGFSKRQLCARLQEAGIEYVHFGDLGDPKPGREAARSGNMPEFRRIYCEHLATEPAQQQLDELMVCVQDKATVLLCYEREAKMCHRAIVASEINRALGFAVQNLVSDEPARYVRFAEKLPRFHHCESIAAAE